MLTIEDRLAIEALYRQYCWAADTGDGEAWVATFTASGIFDVNGDVTTGRKALQEWVRARDASREREPTVGQHWVTNLQVEGDGDTARARSYYMRTVTSRGDAREATIAAAGWSLDDLRKVDGVWAFERRVLSKRMPWREPTPFG